MARGHRGSLLLRCRALPSPSPCRFIPALSMTRGRRGSLLLRRRAFPSPPPSRFIPAHGSTKPVASAGKPGDCPRPGRRLRPRPLACGRCRARQPTPGGRPRYRQAGGDPPSRSTGTAPSAWRARAPLAGHDALEPGERHVGRFSPRPGARLSGGRPEPVKGALLRRVPSGRPLTEPRPRVPRTPWHLSG